MPDNRNWNRPIQIKFFVGEKAATAGVKITNNSICEPLVILKHFGPNHPEMPQVSMD